MSKDYYEILGVSRNATTEDIKKAYRKLAHKHHPDKAGGDGNKFKEVNEAYQVLGNEEKRRQYDQFGSNFDSANSGFGFNQGFDGQYGDINFNDFSSGSFSSFFNEDFGDIFSSFFGGKTRTKYRSAVYGDDINVNLDISFREAVFGVEKEINIYKKIICPKCNGNQAEPGTKISDCRACGGTGQLKQTRQTILGSFTQIIVCPECKGEGKKPEKLCSRCKGEGRIDENKKIKIKIPAGINSGQVIRIKSGGEAGFKGGTSGDLFVNISVIPDKYFKRQGDDIKCKVPISFIQAVLGDKVEINTLDGWIRIKIPAGIQSGRILKIRGKGVYKLGKSGRGDLLIEIVVVIPTKLSRKEKILLRELVKIKGQLTKVKNDLLEK